MNCEPKTLFVVATPIGNLKDISLRALETLENTDIVYCENTNICKKLLSHYNILKPVKHLNERNQKTTIKELLSDLENSCVAYLTDAGTPGISDPGGFVVEQARKAGARVEVIPGASALTAAIMGSGIDMSKFYFLGYIPNKTKREKFIKEAAASKYPVVFFESVHRMLKLAKQLKQIAPNKKLIIARELTKSHEEFIHTNARDLEDFFLQNKEKLKGEFVVILYD